MKTLVGTPDPADDWGSGKGSFGGDWYGMRKRSFDGDPSTQSRKFAPDLLPGDAKTLGQYGSPSVGNDYGNYYVSPAQGTLWTDKDEKKETQAAPASPPQPPNPNDPWKNYDNTKYDQKPSKKKKKDKYGDYGQ